jgi:hypothetical protein
MRAKVWNDNTYPFTQKFKDEVITIPPNSFIWMEELEANDFRGLYSPIVVDFDNRQLPSSYKMIRVEKISADGKPVKTHKCFACGITVNSKEALDEHTDKFHLDELSDPEVAEKRRGRPRKDVAA